jgi:hypothetical protein
MLDRSGMEETSDRFVPRDECARENGQDDDDASQVFHAPVAVRKAPGRSEPREGESDAERQGCRRVGEVVNRVGQERHAARDPDDHELESGCQQQASRRPLQRPDPARRARDGRVHDTMVVMTTSIAMFA